MNHYLFSPSGKNLKVKISGEPKPPTMSSRPLLFGATIALNMATSGCGNKGDLYVPDDVNTTFQQTRYTPTESQQDQD